MTFKKFLILLIVGTGVFFAGRWALGRIQLSSVPIHSYDQIAKMIDDTEYDEAIKSARKRIFEDSRDFPACALLGSAYDAKGEYAKAVKVFEKLAEDTQSVTAYYHLAQSQYHGRRIDEALATLRLAESLLSSDATVQKAEILAIYSLLGEIYMDVKKEYSRAILAYKKMVELDSENWQARYRLGTAYAYTNQSSSAYSQFESIIQGNPGSEIAKYAENALQYVRERRTPKKSTHVLF